jgi:hypothetical protein
VIGRGSAPGSGRSLAFDNAAFVPARKHRCRLPNKCMQPTGVSGAIFRFGASVSAFPFGNLALAPAADAGRWAASTRFACSFRTQLSLLREHTYCAETQVKSLQVCASCAENQSNRLRIHASRTEKQSRRLRAVAFCAYQHSKRLRVHTSCAEKR